MNHRYLSGGSPADRPTGPEQHNPYQQPAEGCDLRNTFNQLNGKVAALRLAVNALVDRYKSLPELRAEEGKAPAPDPGPNPDPALIHKIDEVQRLK